MSGIWRQCRGRFLPEWSATKARITMQSKSPRFVRRVFALLVASALPITAYAIPIVNLSLTSSSVNEGDSFIVNANVTGVTDLYAWQFDLAFTPDLIGVSGDASEGAFLASAGSTFFIPGSNDN